MSKSARHLDGRTMSTFERCRTWLVAARTPAACMSMMRISMTPPASMSAVGRTSENCCSKGICETSCESVVSIPPTWLSAVAATCRSMSGVGSPPPAAMNLNLGSDIIKLPGGWKKANACALCKVDDATGSDRHLSAAASIDTLHGGGSNVSRQSTRCIGSQGPGLRGKYGPRLVDEERLHLVPEFAPQDEKARQKQRVPDGAV